MEWTNTGDSGWGVDDGYMDIVEVGHVFVVGDFKQDSHV